MSRLERRTLLAGLGVAALGACAGPIRIGEGKKPPKGGIGGTGIVGTLTDFGSLIVNGLRVGTDRATSITDTFGTVPEAALQIGQVLTIEAADGPDGLIARRVHITHPVIGRVEIADRARRSGVVASVPVALEDAGLGQLEPGTRVAVSGVWEGDRVVASRIDRLADDGPTAIAGVLRGADNLAGRRVAGLGPEAPEPGTFVTAIGRHGPSGLEISDLVPGRFTGAAGALIALSVEGYLEPSPEAPFRAVSGLGHSFDPASRLSPFETRRTLFTGAYTGTFAVEDGLILPEDLNKRRRLIRAVLAGKDVGSRLPTR